MVEDRDELPIGVLFVSVFSRLAVPFSPPEFGPASVKIRGCHHH
jgi:hypothetical protein